MVSGEPTNPGDEPPPSFTTHPADGGEESGAGDGGGEASALQQNSAETDPDSDSPVADVAAPDGGGDPEIKAEKAGRKRGRAARGPADKVKPVVNPQRKREKKDEEDVCFICFDGGELVVCDRRSCPKAYHPSCVKRSQSFFRSKAKWNCGWHICTSCQKKAHFMCYACPHSLCKTCYKNADFICIRETKGLCGTCRGTIMLIENINEGNKDMVQVDFDDKLSWEYLFKVYWTDLKEKLSLTVEEITRAKRPQKERKRRSKRTCENIPNGYAKLGNPQQSYTCGSIGWASKELLEFVGYMKEGDTSALSRFEVQALLLEYINRSNLHDPRQKWQISCDMRLMKLFGKASVDHFEMLKLLDSHFHSKENPVSDGIARATDLVGGPMDIDLNKDEEPVVDNDRKLEPCEELDKKDDHIHHNDCKGIDSQRIRSIFLQRNSIENLINDFEQLQRKVAGSIVRIRVSGKDQMEEMHRLAQVMGAIKTNEFYRFGDKTTNIKLEIQNFDRKETISIDEISDSDFLEEECERFNLSVRCGPIGFKKVEDPLDAQSVKAEQVIDESSYQHPVMMNKAVPCQGIEDSTVSSQNNAKNQADATSSVTRDAVSGAGSEISPSPLSTATEQSVNDDETYKMWHYQDSNGKVQGPFTMLQMRKWKIMGQFPHDQRIWRNDEKQEDSILLTDALHGHFVKEPQSLHSQKEVRLASEDRECNLDGVSSISVNTNNNSRSDSSSHLSTQSIKTERLSNKEACKNVPGLFVGPSKMLFGPVGGTNGFNCEIPSRQEMSVGQTPGVSTGKRAYNGESYSSSNFSTQSSGQNWRAPSPVVTSSIGNLTAGSLVNPLIATLQQSNGPDVFRSFPGSAQRPIFENYRSSNVSIGELGSSWTAASSVVNGAVTYNRTVNSDWGSNFPAASQKPTETCAIDGSTLTLGSAQLTPPSTGPPPFSWQAMIMDPEFTSLPEESVSDLLAELEASEPLNTSFPSPSPKCTDGMRGLVGTRNEGLNLDASFFSVPQLARIDSFNSRNFPNPSPAVANEPFGSCYFNSPSQTMQRMIMQENYSTATHGYRNVYPEHGQVNWVNSMERNAETWQQQQQQHQQPQQQQQTNPYFGVSRSSNPSDQFFGGFNLDIGRGSSIWDRQ